MQFVPDRFKTQEMCDKAVDTCQFVSDSVLDWYITQLLSDKILSENPYLLRYCPDKYKTQKMRSNAVNICLLYWNFFLIGLLQIRWLRKLIVLYFLMII